MKINMCTIYLKIKKLTKFPNIMTIIFKLNMTIFQTNK